MGELVKVTQTVGQLAQLKVFTAERIDHHHLLLRVHVYRGDADAPQFGVAESQQKGARRLLREQLFGTGASEEANDAIVVPNVTQVVTGQLEYCVEPVPKGERLSGKMLFGESRPRHQCVHRVRNVAAKNLLCQKVNVVLTECAASILKELLT